MEKRSDVNLWALIALWNYGCWKWSVNYLLWPGHSPTLIYTAMRIYLNILDLTKPFLLADQGLHILHLLPDFCAHSKHRWTWFFIFLYFVYLPSIYAFIFAIAYWSIKHTESQRLKKNRWRQLQPDTTALTHIKSPARVDSGVGFEVTLKVGNPLTLQPWCFVLYVR